MKRFLLFFALFMALASTAFAFGFGDVKSWVMGNFMGTIATAGCAALSFALKIIWQKNTARYNLVAKTLIEAGQFFEALGNMIQDPAITKDEIAKTIKEGKDVIDLYKKTPDAYVAAFPADPSAPVAPAAN